MGYRFRFITLNIILHTFKSGLDEKFPFKYHENAEAMVSNQYAMLRFEAMLKKEKKEVGKIYVFLKKSGIILLHSTSLTFLKICHDFLFLYNSEFVFNRNGRHLYYTRPMRLGAMSTLLTVLS